jgi:AraC-like DNA-binding protein
MMGDTLLRDLKFEYVEGNCTPVKTPHSTGWRQMPYWVIVVPVHSGVFVETHEHGKLFCKAGNAILTIPNMLHCFSCNSSDYISHWSHVRFTLPGDIDAADFLDVPLIVGPPVSNQINRINTEMAEWKKKSENASIRLASKKLELGFTLLSTICSVSQEKSGLSLLSSGVERIRDLLVFIDRHLHEELDRDDLAQRAGLSAARFHVVFEEIVGVPPMNFVKRQRMKKAQILLAETQRSVKENGDQVGYLDAYTFSRAFKNTVGISPKRYRERSRKLFSE